MNPEKTHRVLAILLKAALLTGCSADMMAQTITEIDAPNGSHLIPYSINTSGAIAGTFSDVSQSGKVRGFVRERDGTFTAFDAPNASSTSALSMNFRRDVAGAFQDTTLVKLRGFIRDWSGSFTLFDAPNSGTLASVRGMNYSGEVVGTFDAGGRRSAFLRNGDGSFTIFDAPNASATEAYSVNDRGEVAGTFSDTTQAGKTRAFVRDRNGNFTEFDAPNASSTTALSINYAASVTGSFSDTSQSGKSRAFIRDRNGNFIVFDAPGASGTFGVSIDYGGDVAGDLNPGIGDSWFLRDANGNFISLALSAPFSEVASLNDREDVIGDFIDAIDKSRRGWVRFAPAQSTQWTGLSGNFPGKIAVAANADGRMQAFVRGGDNGLWTIAQTAPRGPWSPWQSLGGVINGDPVGRAGRRLNQ